MRILHSSWLPRLALVIAALLPAICPAADTWQRGTINNITSTQQGLLIRLDTGLPDNCAGTPYGWMLIPEANKTLIATTLMLWAMGTRSVDIYTVGRPNGGYCVIEQVDPL